MNYKLIFVIAFLEMVNTMPLENTLKCRHPHINDLIYLYSKEYTNHLNEIKKSLHLMNKSHLLGESTNTHVHESINSKNVINPNLACGYTYKTVIRNDRYPYAIQEAVLINSRNVLNPNINYECRPIQVLRLDLVQTNECENNFFKFEPNFDKSTIGFKFVFIS
ncbi:unnamed protein product [Brachionus calyciflorus]|uniref:Uncharacterized protein n=1 Tax=Brachionus calyciflorus TaxID=104777 RepID=A0A814F064_9BILA|nr:unnamed protein product [Brachionus calyciflorus]